MAPSINELLEQEDSSSSATGDNGKTNGKKSINDLLEESVYTAPSKKKVDTKDSETSSDDSSTSIGTGVVSPSPSTLDVPWKAPDQPELPKAESFQWDQVPFAKPVKQPAAATTENKQAPVETASTSVINPESSFAKNQDKANTIISNDVEVNATYSPNKPVLPTPADNPDDQQQTNPFAPFTGKQPLPAPLKEAIKNSVLNGAGTEVIDYYNVRKGMMQDQLDKLDQQMHSLTRAEYQVTPKSGARLLGTKVTDQGAYDELAKQKVSLQEQMTQMETATETIAAKNLSKKYTEAGPDNSVAIFNINAAQKDGMVMMKLKDPVTFERLQARMDKSLPLNQNDQARLAGEGYQARLQSAAADLDNTIENSKPALNNIDQQAKLVNNLSDQIDKEKDVTKKNELIGQFNNAKATYDQLKLDPTIAAVTSKINEFNNLHKNALTLTDNFPEVRREEITQALANEFYDMVQTKKAVSGYTGNPMLAPMLAASLIFNEEPDEQDYKALAEKFTKNGVPLTPEQVKEYAKGKPGAMKDNNLRVDGFLSSIAQATYRTIQDVKKSASRWDWLNQALAEKAGIYNTDEDINQYNEDIDKKLNAYTRSADQAKISQPGMTINTEDGSQNFSRKEVNKKAGEMNLSAGAVTNIIGDGIAQLAIFGAAGRIGGLLGEVATKAVPLADIVPKALVSSTTGELAGIDYVQNLYSNADKVAAITRNTQRIGELAGNAGTFFASSYGTHYDAASKLTNDKDLIKASALANSTIDAASTLILPQVDIMKSLEGERGALFSSFEKLFQESGKKVTPDLMKHYAGEVMAKLGMPTKVGAEAVIRAVGEPMADQAILNKDIDWAQLRDQAKTAFVTGFISTLPLAPFVGGGMRNRSDLMEHSMYEAGVNPEKYKAYVNDQVSKGNTPDATGDRQIAFINTMRDIVNRFPARDPDGKPYSDEQKRTWAVEDFRILYDRFQAKRTDNDAMREQFEADAKEGTNVQREILQIGGQQAQTRQKATEEAVVARAETVKADIEKTAPEDRTDKQKEKYDVANNIISSLLSQEDAPTDTEVQKNDTDVTESVPKPAKSGLNGTEEQVEYEDLPNNVKKIVDDHGEDNDKTVFNQKLGEAGYATTHDMESFGEESGVSFIKLDAPTAPVEKVDTRKADIEERRKKELDRTYSQIIDNKEREKEYNRISGSFPAARNAINRFIDIREYVDSKNSNDLTEKDHKEYGDAKDELNNLDIPFLNSGSIENDIYKNEKQDYKGVREKYLSQYSEANRHENKVNAKYDAELAALEPTKKSKPVEAKPIAEADEKLSPAEKKVIEAIKTSLPDKTSVLGKTMLAAAKDPAKHRQMLKELIDQSINEKQMRNQFGDTITDAVLSLGKKSTYEKKPAAAGKKAVVIKARKPKSKSTPLSKDSVAYKVSELDLSHPDDIAMQYFAAGGKIHPSAVDELYNDKSKSKQTNEQRLSMIGMQDNQAPTIQKLAHQLWEDADNDNYTTQDYRNAIETAINFGTAGDMAKHLLKNAVTEDVRGNLTEIESAIADDNFISKAADLVDGLDENVSKEISELLEKYKTADGEINWHQLELDSDGFNPEFLNLSAEATNVIDELIQGKGKTEEPAAEVDEVTPGEVQANIDQAEKVLANAKAKLKDAEKRIGKTGGKQLKIGEAAQTGMFGGLERDEAKKILDPLREKVKLAEQNLENKRNELENVNKKDQPSLFAKEESKWASPSLAKAGKLMFLLAGKIYNGQTISGITANGKNYTITFEDGTSEPLLLSEIPDYLKHSVEPTEEGKVIKGLQDMGVTPADIINSQEAEDWIEKHDADLEAIPSNRNIPQELFSDFELPKTKEDVTEETTKRTKADNTGQSSGTAGTDTEDQQVQPEAPVGDIQRATESSLDEDDGQTQAAIAAAVERLTARKSVELKPIVDQIADLERQLRELMGGDENMLMEADAATEGRMAALRGLIAELKTKQAAIEQRYDTLINKKLSYGTNGNRSLGTGAKVSSGRRVPGTISGNGSERSAGQISTQEGTNGPDTSGEATARRDAAIRGERGSVGRTYGNTIGAEPNAVEIKKLGGVPGELPEREAGQPVIVPVRNGNNFVIPPNMDNTPTFNSGKKYDDNIAAMEALVSILRDKRDATPEEKTAIFKYVGFGGLKDVLVDPTHPYGWKESNLRYKPKVADVYRLAGELEKLGLDDVLQSIKSSTSSAFFTPYPVIRAVYHGLEKMGFTGGKVLDPSAGIGHFFGMMPYNLAKVSDLHGVEIDKITGNILKLLYPDSNISVSGLENAGTLPSYYDLVISNIPFGENRVYDPVFNKSKDATLKRAQGRIHNYFFAKAINDVRPGGIVAFITSTGVLDSPDNDFIRKYLTDNAEVLGVFRLPDSTFKGNANTEAVSDLIYLRKYQVGEAPKESPISELYQTSVEHKNNGNSYDVELNKYFETHPENILGTLQAGGQYREDDYTVLPNKDKPLEDQLTERINAVLPDNIYKNAVHNATDPEAIKRFYVEHANNLRPGNLLIENGKTMMRVVEFDGNNSQEVAIPKSHQPKVESFIKVRDAMNKLYGAEIGGTDEEELVPLRENLNKVYDAFVKKFGYFSKPTNGTMFSLDIDGYNVRGLERYNKEGKVVKADIFTKRVVNPYVRITKADNIENAVLVSLNEYGRINMNRIQELMGISKDEVLQLSKGQIFEEPDGGFVTRNEYLSGNVKKKLRLAEQAAKIDKKFEYNVEELKAVLPQDIPASEIEARLGARWLMIDPASKQQYVTKIFEDFAEHLFQAKTKVSYLPSSDTYRVAIQGYSAIAAAKYRVATKDAAGLMEDALHSTPPVIWRTIKDPLTGKDKRIRDEEPTKAAVDKFYQIRNEFGEWVMKDEKRREFLQNIYNETYNTSIKRSFDGSVLKDLPGYAGPHTPKNYQLSGAWMILQNIGGIIDHIVGAGKTLVMIIACMEMKRLGIAKKPMIIALKANVSQISESFREAYPLAKILAPSDKDFSAQNRKALLSQIAMNDWDAVIITHDNYVSIPQSPEIETEIINQEMEHLDIDMEQLRASGGELSKQQLKGLETRKKNLNARLQALKDTAKDVELRNFQDLGIDHLMVDESQMFKNLTYTTKLSNVAGMGKAEGAKKTLQLLMGIRYLQKLHRGDKGTTLLSGTPISNSIVELYLLLKYLRPAKLQELNMTTLDSWASNFATNYMDVEYSVTGSLKTKDRFREFVNMPELSMLYNEIADVRNDSNIDPPIPKPKGVIKSVAIDPTPAQLDFFKKLDDFARSMKNKDGQEDIYARRLGLGTLTEGQKKSYMLLCTDLGTKAAIDLRMVFPGARSDGGKLFTVADSVYNEWKESTPYKGTQLIFCDKGTPKSGKPVDDLYDLLQDKYKMSDEDLRLVFGEETSKPRIEAVKKRLNEIMNYTPEEINDLMQEAKEENVTSFNVYSEIRRQLIKKGIPGDEIAFIHSYNTQIQKDNLFTQVKAGIVRVLIGSTGKLGTGVNVQKLLIALHHVDAPWRPSDMVQREGRGVRQGNEGAELYHGNEVNIYQYATKNSLDALKYQYLDIKQKFYDQLRSGSLGKRTYTENDDSVGYAEMAAALSGNPAILEKAKTEKKLVDLERQRKQFRQSQYDAASQIRNEQVKIDNRRDWIKNTEEDLKVLNENKKINPETGERIFELEIFGKHFDKPKEAGEYYLDEWEKLNNSHQQVSRTIGKIYGFKISLVIDQLGFTKLKLIGNGTSYDVTNSMDPMSAALAFDRATNGVERNLKIYRDGIEKSEALIKAYQEEQKGEWGKEDELKAAQTRLDEINAELNEAANKVDKPTAFPDTEDEEGNQLEDPEIHYARSSTGQNIPFKIFDTGNSLPLLREGDDFIGVERQFTEFKQLDFTGPVKISSADDVAWLMRSLESEGVEHMFAVYVKPDGSYVIHHVSTGGVTGTVLDSRLVNGNALKLGAKDIYLIHNHPSGNLVPSSADRLLFKKAREAMPDHNVHTLIMNLTSGYYLQAYESDEVVKPHNAPSRNLPQQVLIFSKQVFAEGYNPQIITNSADVAAYIQAQRFGSGPKTEMLVVNQANHIMAKLSVPFEFNNSNRRKIINYIIESVTHAAGTGYILFGNQVADDDLIKAIKNNVALSDIRMMDYMQIKSNDSYSSYLDEGLLYEPGAQYGAAETKINNTLKDSASKEEAILKAFTNLAFLDIKNNKGYPDFAAGVKDRHNYSDQKVLKQAYADAQKIYDVMISKDAKAINDLIDKTTFGPLRDNLEAYRFQEEEAANPAINTFAQAATENESKADFVKNVTPVFPVTPYGETEDYQVYTTNRNLANAYAQKLKNEKRDLHEAAKKAESDLETLTGDTPVEAGFKLYRNEYDNKTADQVEQFLITINRADDFDKQTDVQDHYIDFNNPYVFDAANLPLSEIDVQKLMEAAKAQNNDALIIKNTFDDKIGGNPIPANIAFSWNTTNIKTEEDLNDQYPDEDFLKDFTLKSTRQVNQLMSGETIADVFGEKPEGNQDYNAMDLNQMLTDGEDMIVAAQNKFGSDILSYAPVFLDYLKGVKWEDKAKKSVALATLINKLNEAKLETEPQALGRKIAIDKVLQRTYAYWQQFIRDASLTLNAARLMRIFRDKNLSDFYTDKILDESQRREKAAILKAEGDAKVQDEIAANGAETTASDVKNSVDKQSEKKAAAKAKKKQVPASDYKAKAEQKLKAITSKNSLAEKIINAINKNPC